MEASLSRNKFFYIVKYIVEVMNFVDVPVIDGCAFEIILDR